MYVSDEFILDSTRWGKTTGMAALSVLSIPGRHFLVSLCVVLYSC